MLPSLAYASAWIASVAVLVAPFPGAEIWPFSRAAAAALPWLVLAGVPCARLRPGGPSAVPLRCGAAVAHWTAGAVAPLLVGARLDQLDGLDPGLLAGLVAASLATIAGLALGAARANGDARQACGWALGVLFPPVLCAVLTLLPAETADGAHGSFLAGLSPVGWAWSASGAPEPALQGWTLALPLATTALVAVGFHGRARARTPPETP